MSTLVKFLMALVLHFVSADDLHHDATVSKTETHAMKHTLQELNPHYIITREELLSYTNKTAI